MTVRPAAASQEAFTTLCQDEAALRPGVQRLCRPLGVEASELTRYPAGSRPVGTPRVLATGSMTAGAMS